jgi:hypothetical protein
MRVIPSEPRIYTCTICEEEIFPIDREKNCPNCNNPPPHNPITHWTIIIDGPYFFHYLFFMSGFFQEANSHSGYREQP